MDWGWLILILYALLTEYRLARLRGDNRRLQGRLTRLGYAVLLGLAAPDRAVALPLPRAADGPGVTPVDQLRLALTDLVTQVQAQDAPYTRYLSLHAILNLYGEATLPAFRISFRDQLNRKNAGRNPVPEVEVDGPRGTVAVTRCCTLLRIDLRRAPNWTRPAWVLVADRDYLFREAPLGPLPHVETQLGRLICGIEQNPKTLAAGFLLNAWQLHRDLQELARSETGHDLLYAAERHPDPEKVVQFAAVGAPPPAAAVQGPAGLQYPYNAFVTAERALVVDEQRRVRRELPRGAGFQVTNKPNEYGYVYGVSGTDSRGTRVEGFVLATSVAFDAELNPAPAAAPAPPKAPPKGVPFVPARPIGVRDAGKGQADFPATLTEFKNRWGARGRKEKLKVFLFDTSVGGIALGADSDPERGSFVAAGGDRVVVAEESEFGVILTTFDSKVPKDGFDQIERNQFLNITQGIVKKDGGECLATMPNGMQAEALFDQDENLVAVANPELAVHLEKKSTDPRYPSVRVGYCASCHAANNGYNPFVEQYADSRASGIKFNVPADQAQQVDDFYLGWQRRTKRWRLPYAEYLEAVSGVGKDGNPTWSGTQLWAAQMDWRDRYDRPPTVRTLAADWGAAVEDVRGWLLQRHEQAGPPLTRLNQLAVDRPVPRRTYDANVAGAAALWFDLVNPRPQNARAIVAQQVLDDAVKKFALGSKK